jgi:hypothetical protein
VAFQPLPVDAQEIVIKGLRQRALPLLSPVVGALVFFRRSGYGPRLISITSTQ